VEAQSLLMSPTHPDLHVQDNYLFVTYGLNHYPKTGCGSNKSEPCRGKNDIVVSTSHLEVWRID
jgi:hypothetical protein